MKEIYVVTSGIWSGYEINAVFDDRELAERYAEVNNKHISKDDEMHWHRVEVYELNPYGEGLRDPSRKPYYVQMAKDGTTTKIEGRKELEDNPTEDFVCGRDSGNQEMAVIVLAKDEKHAIKIANEKRAVLIAENRWPEKMSLEEEERLKQIVHLKQEGQEVPDVDRLFCKGLCDKYGQLSVNKRLEKLQ